MKVKGLIYIYISPSGKTYVGQTINERERRYSFLNINERYSGIKFEAARKKYKPENFIYEIIFEDWFSSNDEAKNVLDEMEKYYIELYDSYNNGYNGNLGGSSNIGYKHSEETKLKFSGINAPQSKPLVVFDLYANIVGVYVTITEASKKLNIDKTVLTNVPKTFYKTFIGKEISLDEYIRHINGEKIEFTPDNTDKLRYIAQINTKTNEIVNCFITAQEAAEANGLKRGTSITNVLNGYKPTAANHFWKRINYEEYINWKRLL